MKTPEVPLSTENWKEIKTHARPGDVLLLRHRPVTPPPPEETKRDCLLELIHILDGPYDHAAVVRTNDGNGNVMIAHATTAAHAVVEQSLDDLRKWPVEWVRAELRRRWARDESHDADVAQIAAMASAGRWSDARYGFGDLLVAGLAATGGSHVRNRDDEREIDEDALKVVRAHLLALCYIDITDVEAKQHTAGVTCASFVNSCHDDENKLAREYSTIGERIDELERGAEGGADAADRLVEEYRLELRKEGGMRHLLSTVLCLDSVAAEDEVSDGQVAHLSAQLLHTFAKLPEAAPEPAMAGGEPEESKPSTNRPLVRIEDLHTDAHLSFEWVEPPGSCACELPPQAQSPRRGHFHLP